MKRILIGSVVVLGLSAQLAVGAHLLLSSRARAASAATALAAAEAARERAEAAAEERAARARKAEVTRALDARAERDAAEAALRAERDAARTLERLGVAARAERARAEASSLACLEQARRAEDEERHLAELAHRERLEALIREDLARQRRAVDPSQAPVGDVRGEGLRPGEELAFAAVREAVLAGDDETAARAVRKFNDGVRDGPPLVLHGDESRRRGIELAAVYGTHGARFEVSLAATGKEPARLVVAPGTRVKSVGDHQDTTVVDLMVLDVSPSRGRILPAATVCCVDIRKGDPRSVSPVAVDLHPSRDVVTVARFAARERSDWMTTQVALWAVANDPTKNELQAHGSPAAIPAALELLQRSGIDTDRLALFRAESAKPRGDLLEAPRLRIGRRG